MQSQGCQRRASLTAAFHVHAVGTVVVRLKLFETPINSDFNTLVTGRILDPPVVLIVGMDHHHDVGAVPEGLGAARLLVGAVAEIARMDVPRGPSSRAISSGASNGDHFPFAPRGSTVSGRQWYSIRYSRRAESNSRLSGSSARNSFTSDSHCCRVFVPGSAVHVALASGLSVGVKRRQSTRCPELMSLQRR